MGFSDDWTSCMHRMQLPTPSEAWHSAAEALEKLHEIDMAMGGIGLAEAAESFEAVGVAIEVGAEAAPILVSWWAGNAVGCIVTAAVGDRIVDAIDYILEPVNWDWISAKMLEVSYPMPSFEGLGAQEEVAMDYSSTAQDDAPPNPILEPNCTESDWVEYAQGLLNLHGYDLAVDGKFGTHTTAAVLDFKQRNGLGAGPEIDYYTWQHLEIERLDSARP
jgi:hypothetical protein